MGLSKLEGNVYKVVEKSIFDEIDVLYIIVESWKICEQKSIKNRYPYLRFFRNWCVHTKIDRLDEEVASVIRADMESLEEKLTFILDSLFSELDEIFDTCIGVKLSDENIILFKNSLLEILSEQPINFEIRQKILIIDPTTKELELWENLGSSLTREEQ